MPINPSEYYRMQALAEFSDRVAHTLNRVASGSEARTLLSRNPLRAGLIIYNASATTALLVRFGQDDVTSSVYSDRIAPTERLNYLDLGWGECPRQQITVLGDGGEVDVKVTEWSLIADADEFNVNRVMS